MTTITSDYTGRKPDGSIILSPTLVGTIETTGRHATRATEEKLTAFFRASWQKDPEDCAVVTIGRRSYIFHAGHWQTIKPEPPPPPAPEHSAAILTVCGHKFSNGNDFLMFRFPKANWHKAIVPALRRLYRRLTGNTMHHGDNAYVFSIMADGDPAEFFGKSKYAVKYDYVDGEFAELPSKKSDGA